MKEQFLISLYAGFILAIVTGGITIAMMPRQR